jgi:hypothetical protein
LLMKKMGVCGRFRQAIVNNYLSQLNGENYPADAPKQSPYNPVNPLNLSRERKCANLM